MITSGKLGLDLPYIISLINISTDNKTLFCEMVKQRERITYLYYYELSARSCLGIDFKLQFITKKVVINVKFE